MKKLLRTLISLALCLSLVLLPVSALTVDQARDLLEDYYVDDLPEAALRAKTLEELFAAIGDPYTGYMTEEEYNSFISSINDGSLVGIGVSVQSVEQGVLIASVLDGSPALDAGMEPGDIIQSVNGTPIHTAEEGQALIAGEEGTSVHLSVLRRDGSVWELDLVRRRVVIPTTLQYAVSDDGNAGLIVCDSFGDGTASHLYDALVEGEEKGVCTWVIDLRANPGGTSTAAAGAAGWFTGGAVISYFRDYAGDYYYTYAPSYIPVLTEKPAILLTSAYSASGAELFSAAMRDYREGIAVGQRTFGKGVAQLTLTEESYPDLFDGDALKVTVYRFFSPAGTTNDQIGVMPTLLVSVEHTASIALMLTCPVPERPKNHLKIELAGHTFAVDLDQAAKPENTAALTELLEALPPTAVLSCGTSGRWEKLTPAQAAVRLKLDFHSRSFTDLAGTGFETAVDSLAVVGLLSGYGDGTFRPEQEVSRAEFCAMLVNVLGLDLPAVTESAFSDVPAEEWYAPAVNAIASRGLASGYGDGTFRPEEGITQEEAVAMLANLAVILNMNAYEAGRSTPEDGALDSFSGYTEYAQKAAWLLSECGMDLSGLAPRTEATRGVTAELIYRLLLATGILWQ